VYVGGYSASLPRVMDPGAAQGARNARAPGLVQWRIRPPIARAHCRISTVINGGCRALKVGLAGSRIRDRASAKLP
jgi:hypothetical protein